MRNEVVHSKPAPPMEASVRFLRSYVDTLIGTKLHPQADPAKGKSPIVYERPMQSVGVRWVPEEKTWKAPQMGWSKLNTDGAFSAGNAGAGMILRDHNGDVNFSACRVLYSCRDALEAELCACMEGLSLALHRSNLPIMVEMDSLEAVTMIACEVVDRSLYASIVKEIKYLLSLRQSRIIHIARLRIRLVML